jgi:hypothetical protein
VRKTATVGTAACQASNVQGLRRHRRCTAWLWALLRVREDQGAIFKHGEESLRLHPRLDECQVLVDGLTPQMDSTISRSTGDEGI